MLSTRAVVELLHETNPDIPITEEIVRHAIRRGAVRRPALFAGRLLWTEDDIIALANALAFDPPTFTQREIER